MITNKYLKFSLNVFILLLLTGISDQVIGRVLKHYYFKQKSGLYYRTTFAIDSTTARILVFGSSRANHHYVPESFEESLDLDFYNSGREGNFLLYNYAVFKAVLKRYTPKIVLFDLNFDELYYDKTGYDRLSSLLPYYRSHPEIRSIVELKSPFERVKLFSEIYPFNSALLTIFIGNTEQNRIRKNDRKGYVPLIGTLQDTVLREFKIAEGTLDTNKINALKDIIECCDSKGIRLMIIQSPVYAIVNKTASSELVEKMAGKHKILFMDYSNHPEFITNPGYFQDQDHLNDTGAKCFSKLIVQELKSTLNHDTVEINLN